MTLLERLRKAIARDYETFCKEADHRLITQYDTARRRASDEAQAWASGLRSGKFEENLRVMKIIEEMFRE